jgi:hypothetical protein
MQRETVFTIRYILFSCKFLYSCFKQHRIPRFIEGLPCRTTFTISFLTPVQNFPFFGGTSVLFFMTCSLSGLIPGYYQVFARVETRLLLLLLLFLTPNLKQSTFNRRRPTIQPLTATKNPPIRSRHFFTHTEHTSKLSTTANRQLINATQNQSTNKPSPT